MRGLDYRGTLAVREFCSPLSKHALDLCVRRDWSLMISPKYRSRLAHKCPGLKADHFSTHRDYSRFVQHTGNPVRIAVGVPEHSRVGQLLVHVHPELACFARYFGSFCE